jgi:hypothetical protein
MISSASFVSGSARGSNGFGGGDNSATVEKINQSEAIKTNSEAEHQKILPIRFSRSVASSARLASASSVMDIFFTFLHNFMSHLSATIHPDIIIEFSAHQGCFG